MPIDQCVCSHMCLVTEGCSCGWKAARQVKVRIDGGQIDADVTCNVRSGPMDTWQRGRLTELLLKALEQYDQENERRDRLDVH